MISSEDSYLNYDSIYEFDEWLNLEWHNSSKINIKEAPFFR